jgi:SAM-dependent MidA family methyltransferase
MKLRTELAVKINKSGSIKLDEFMSLVIPYYYQNANPFGKNGDFITAPEISQMFGEIIAVWAADIWMKNDCPEFNIIELGPGKGTLTTDLLRGSKSFKNFHQSIKHITLIESSQSLREIQAKNLIAYRDKLQWFNHLNDVSTNTFTIIIANEFLDALPIKQFVKRSDGFHEIEIGLNADEKFDFIESATASELSIDCNDGDIVEISEASLTYADSISSLLKQNGGTLLCIDYGYLYPSMKSTLQAVKNHCYHPVLEDIGEADITSLVDFAKLKNRFIKNSLHAVTLTQREFLLHYGILERAKMLAHASGDNEKITSELSRLTDVKEMGELFKVLIAYC